MSFPTFPEPIAAYFAADATGPEHVARCFTPDGVVKDEGRTYTGREAIRAWKAAADAKFSCTTDPFSSERNDGAHVVHAHVAGNFSGSPIDLQYCFRLERGLIADMEIAA